MKIGLACREFVNGDLAFNLAQMESALKAAQGLSLIHISAEPGCRS